MRRIALLILIAAIAASCRDGGKSGKGAVSSGDRPVMEKSPATETGAGTELPAGAVLIASDIVTEVIIRPDPEGDPWEAEKVAGYNGGPLVEGIFSRIYDGSLTVYDYHSGEPLSRDDVKKIEGEFKNDRTKIGKLSFTEDWYYYPEENRLDKRAKSVTFGYELYNNLGKVYAYRAAFRADLQQ